MKMPDVLLSNLRDMVFERNIEKIKSILEISPDELNPEDFVTLDEVNLIVLESLELLKLHKKDDIPWEYIFNKQKPKSVKLKTLTTRRATVRSR